jgi:putative ATP-dependent endonuclease of the OLD family
VIIKALHIKNFRCFGEEPTAINFADSGLNALIGPNNAGKSTVLRVLDILLGDKWPVSQFSIDDFHNNITDDEIVIACNFCEPLTLTDGSRTYRVAGVVVRAIHIPSGYGENSIQVDYRLLATAANIADLDLERLDILRYGGSTSSYVYINQTLKNQLPVVLTIPLIKLGKEQPTNKWGVLGRMLQKVEEEFSKDEAKKNEFETELKNAVSLLKIEEFLRIENDIKENWNRTKPANLDETELEFLDCEPWRYFRQFKLSIRQRGQTVPLETLGEGVQRLAIIALYRCYLKRHGRNERAILLIEEPEAYLHPQARRMLFDLLQSAILETDAVEGQIIYTTHSEDFVDCGRFNEIILFSRSADHTIIRSTTREMLERHTIACGQAPDRIADQYIHYRLVETASRGLKEALFAHRTVVVEGPSEVELLRFISKANKEQVAIVSAGGKSGIPSLVTFISAFGIPNQIITDRDASDSSDSDEQNNKLLAVIRQNNAKEQDETREDIDLIDIKDVPDGSIKTFARLQIFSINLERMLKANVPRWTELLAAIRARFNLPTENNKPGPRDIRALGMIYTDSSLCDEDLGVLLAQARSSLELIGAEVDEFLDHEIARPALLEPRQS